MTWYNEKFIAKADLKHGAYYEGHCRNARYARWNGDEEIFYHWRTKFKFKYLECIHHPDDEQVYDVFYPHDLIEVPVEEIPWNTNGQE